MIQSIFDDISASGLSQLPTQTQFHLLAALNIPVTYVAPATWTRAMGKPQGKDASRHRAMELFPDHQQRFKRVMDDGRAEAALIATWGIRHA